jgi:ATP phosphoribosyltransferase
VTSTPTRWREEPTWWLRHPAAPPSIAQEVADLGRTGHDALAEDAEDAEVVSALLRRLVRCT